MSLTPHARNQEASNEAMQEGLISGGFVLVPTVGVLYMALQHSKKFVARTNWQSRTAIAIMPALFTFAFTAENYLHDKMQAIAHEEKGLGKGIAGGQVAEKDLHLMSLYAMSKEDAHVNVVPGDQLGLHHRLANYVSANPIKALAALAVPSVGLILYGRTGQEHLKMSVKFLHTRVFGQFTTISLLLSIMGFKEYMDRHGLYITEVESFRRAEEMRQIRQQVLERLEYQHHVKEDQERELAKVHEEEILRLSRKQQAKKQKTTEDNMRLVQATDVVAASVAAATAPSTPAVAH